MLLQSISKYFCNPLTYFGVDETNLFYHSTNNSWSLAAGLNRYAGSAGMNPMVSYPSGYTPNSTFSPARVSGAVAELDSMVGIGIITTANLGYVDNRISIAARIRVNESELLPSDVADAVWDTTLPGTHVGSEAGNFIGTKILTWLKFLGLK